jgi:hypothetical protein
MKIFLRSTSTPSISSPSSTLIEHTLQQPPGAITPVSNHLVIERCRTDKDQRLGVNSDFAS